jgi:predicted signal transduction protein with EAL and GGDEF domain
MCALCRSSNVYAFEKPIAIGGHSLQAGRTIGIASYPSNGANAEELIMNADLAMYHAKELGGDMCAWYSASLHAQAQERGIREGMILDDDAPPKPSQPW